MIPGALKLEPSGVQNGFLEASWVLLEAKSAPDGRTSLGKTTGKGLCEAHGYGAWWPLTRSGRASARRVRMTT